MGNVSRIMTYAEKWSGVVFMAMAEEKASTTLRGPSKRRLRDSRNFLTFFGYTRHDMRTNMNCVHIMIQACHCRRLSLEDAFFPLANVAAAIISSRVLLGASLQLLTAARLPRKRKRKWSDSAKRRVA